MTTTARAFGELTAADLGMPFKHAGIEGTLRSLRHFVDHDGARRTIVFVKVPTQPGKEREADHREIAAAAADTIGGTSR